MRRSPATVLVPVLGVLVLVAAIVVGALLLRGTAPSEPSADPTEPSPSATPSQTPTPSATPTTSTAVLPAYFVGSTGPGPRLFAVRRALSVEGTDADARLQAAVTAVVSGDSGRSDRTTTFPDDTSATVTRGTGGVTVDLTSPGVLSARDEDDAALSLQSVVWTVDAVLGQDVPVTFTVDGSPADTVLSQDASRPVSKDDALGTLGLVQLEAPTGAEPVSSPFTVRGTAAANEAALTWQLRQGSTVVRRGTASTQECCTFSPYSFSVTAPAGSYTLVVSDTDDSGEGRSSADSVEVTVR